MKPVEVNVNFLYYLETSENHRLFNPKWVKQQQYRQEWYILMLLVVTLVVQSYIKTIVKIKQLD